MSVGSILGALFCLKAAKLKLPRPKAGLFPVGILMGFARPTFHSNWVCAPYVSGSCEVDKPESFHRLHVGFEEKLGGSSVPKFRGL